MSCRVMDVDFLIYSMILSVNTKEGRHLKLKPLLERMEKIAIFVYIINELEPIDNRNYLHNNSSTLRTLVDWLKCSMRAVTRIYIHTCSHNTSSKNNTRSILFTSSLLFIFIHYSYMSTGLQFLTCSKKRKNVEQAFTCKLTIWWKY